MCKRRRRAPTGRSDYGSVGAPCALHPRRTLAIWLAVVVASAGIASALLSGALTTQSTFTGTPESQRALDLIQQRLGRKQPILDVVIVQSPTHTVAQPGFRRRVETLRAQLHGRAGRRHGRPDLLRDARAGAGVDRPAQHPDPAQHAG